MSLGFHSSLKLAAFVILLVILVFYPDIISKVISLFFLLHIAWHQVPE